MYSKLNNRDHIFFLMSCLLQHKKAYVKRNTKHLTHNHYKQTLEINDYLQRWNSMISMMLLLKTETRVYKYGLQWLQFI